MAWIKKKAIRKWSFFCCSVLEDQNRQTMTPQNWRMHLSSFPDDLESTAGTAPAGMSLCMPSMEVFGFVFCYSQRDYHFREKICYVYMK